jgi:putative ABC transport system permease protein
MFVIGEALGLGLLSGVVGLGLAVPIVELGMGRWLEENVGAWFPYFRIDPKTHVLALVCAALLAVTASLLPAIRASRLSVTDALRRVV